MQPLVSLIIPSHNHTDLLPGLLDSIMAQSLKELEVIIVDDCSDEPCAPVGEIYRGRGLNVKVLRNDRRRRQVPTLLRGVREARSEILAFADADDLLLGAESLERNVRLMLETDADVVQFRSLAVPRANSVAQPTVYCEPLAPSLDGRELFAAWVERGMPGEQLWNRLYHRQLWERMAPVAARSALRGELNDIYMNSLLLFHAHRYRASNETSYLYRHQLPAERFADRLVNACIILRELVPFFRNHCLEPRLQGLYVDWMQKLIGAYATRFFELLQSGDGFALSMEQVRARFQDVEPNELFMALLLVGRINAEKSRSLEALLQQGLAL